MEMQRHLLLDLRQAMVHLDTIDWHAAGFNMVDWARYKLPETPELNCGTVCCAYGVGTTLPSWKAVGLQLTPNEGPCDGIAIVRHMPSHGENSASILGLTSTQWSHIFGLLTYRLHSAPSMIPPSEVIVHIDDVLDGLVQ